MYDMMTIIHSCKVALYLRKVPVTQESFNASELNKAVRNGCIIIKEGNPGRGAAEFYVSRQ